MITQVDSKDNIVGFVPRDRANGRAIYRIASIWITNAKGEFLLTKRPDHAEHPNKWAAIAGFVRKDESYRDTAVREIYDELNIRINPTKGPKTRWNNHYMQWYTHQIKEDFKLKWAQEYKWFTKDEFLKQEDVLPGLHEHVEMFR